MAETATNGAKPGQPKLLTAWAEDERVRLLGVLKAKELELGIERGQLHPETMPIHRNIMMLEFAFDPKRKHSTGRVRALFVLHSHGRRSGKAWIGTLTLMLEAGFAERKNARKACDDLHSANIVTKNNRPPSEDSPQHLTNVYSIPHKDEADLLDLVFAAATGITALYALVLRKLWVGEDGVGSASVSRKGVRKALAEGVLDAHGNLVLNRTLSDTKIVEHFRTLLSEGLLLKVDNGRLTIPAARGYQAIKEGATRVWDRKDRGKRKSRHVVQSRSFPNVSPPPFVDAVPPPPSRSSANLSPPPRGVYPNLSPPKPPKLPFSITTTKRIDPGQVEVAIHLSPQIASGKPSALADLEDEGSEVPIVRVAATMTDADADRQRFEVMVIDAVGEAAPISYRADNAARTSCCRWILEFVVGEGFDPNWAVRVISEAAIPLVAEGRRFVNWTAVRIAVNRAAKIAFRAQQEASSHEHPSL